MSAVIPQVEPIRAKTPVASTNGETIASLPPFVSDPSLPTHLDLPFEDGEIVENFQEHPQSMLLSDVLDPVLNALHPDGRFCTGADSGVYWKITDPPLRGCLAPDWLYIPNVPPNLFGGVHRRSYAIWQEHVRPLLVAEYVSGNGQAERDRTPETGKFWVYENGICANFYAIFDGWRSTLEVHQRVDGVFQAVPPNDRGHYPIPPMGIELGLWKGKYLNNVGTWLRAWDLNGNLLLTKAERLAVSQDQTLQEKQRAESERQRAESERQRAESERQRAEKLAAQLKALGMEPEA